MNIYALVFLLIGGYVQAAVFEGKVRDETAVVREDLGDDVQIEGVAVINDRVYIDGVRVPKGTHVFISKKTGKRYLINWDKDDNVTVREK